MAKYKITRDKFMTVEEVKRILKVSEERAELDLIKGRMTWVTRYMLVALALRSGLRVGEIAALKIGDIHLNGGDSYLAVKNGKGVKDRDVYCNGNLTKPLKRYIEIKRKSWREPTGPDDFLFSHGMGKPFTPTALHISFKKALEKAGLSSHYSIHSARHTYATILLAETGDLKCVQKQLGHENIAMSSLYADIMQEQRQALADMLTI